MSTEAPMFAAPYTALIADDECIAREGLRTMLGAHPEFHVSAEAETGLEAARALQTIRPDVLFLDVRMPDLDGISMLAKRSPATRPATVFVTAYADYALQAFGLNAVDYLLKPFTPERLADTVRRVVRFLRAVDVERGGPARPRDSALPSGARLCRLAVRDGDRLLFVEAADVEWLEVFGNYLRVAVNGRLLLLRGTMGELSARLDRTWFVRINRSVIVNLRHVRSVRWHLNGQCELQMVAGLSLRSSRRYRRDVRTALAERHSSL